MKIIALIMVVPKILNVAEKNDAAKHIAEIMSRGGFNRREGLLINIPSS